MKYLIIDDNKLARMTLQQLIAQTNLLEYAGECESGLEAISLMSSKKVDLLFLDIEMPGMSGIELLKNLSENPIIIFTTAKKTYAVDVFDLNVADYLLKPVTVPRLLEAIQKARKIFETRNSSVSSVEKDFLFIKDKKAHKKVMLPDILWIEAMGDYIKIHTQEKMFMAHTSLRVLEEKLPADHFTKVHRSYIVSLKNIDYIEDNVIYIHNSPIPVAETYKQHLFRKLNMI